MMTLDPSAEAPAGDPPAESESTATPRSRLGYGLRFGALLIALTAVSALATVQLAAPMRGWLRGPGKIAPYTLVTQPGIDFDRQIAFYQARIRKNPKGFIDLVSLAEIYLRRAKLSGETAWYLLAEQSARKSIASFDQYPGAMLVMAQIALARHEFPQAIAWADKAAALGPGELGPESVYVTARLALGETARAAAAAEALVKRAPGLETYSQRALVRLAQGREAEARQDLMHGIGLEQPGQAEASAQARLWLGRLATLRGREAEAADLYEEALRIKADNPQALGLRAALRLRRGDAAGAGQDYAQAALLNPAPAWLIGRAQAMSALQQPAQAAGLRAEAERRLRRELAGQSFGHRRELASLLLSKQTPQADREALSLMQQELGLRKDPQTYSLLAAALSRNGQWTAARQAMAKALAPGERDAEMLYRAAEIEAALGEPAKARRYVKAADSLDPGFRRDPAFAAYAGIEVRTRALRLPS